MKRILLLFFTILLLFCACQRDQNTKTPPIQAVREAIIGAVDFKEELVALDEDYVEANFSCENEIDDCTIYLGTAREIGIFKLEEDGNAEMTEKTIKEYLKNEVNSISTLLELYPSDELEERLSHYKNATVVQKGRYVCYFALPKSEAEQAEKAMLEALK